MNKKGINLIQLFALIITAGLAVPLAYALYLVSYGMVDIMLDTLNPGSDYCQEKGYDSGTIYDIESGWVKCCKDYYANHALAGKNCTIIPFQQEAKR